MLERKIFIRISNRSQLVLFIVLWLNLCHICDYNKNKKYFKQAKADLVQAKESLRDPDPTVHHPPLLSFVCLPNRLTVISSWFVEWFCCRSKFDRIFPI